MTRKQAQSAYNAALASVRAAENGDDLDTWEKAVERLNTARAELIKCEASDPTPAEIKRSNRKFWLRSIGMDV